MKKFLGYSSINCFCYDCGKYENVTDKVLVTRSNDNYKLFYVMNNNCRIFVDGTEYAVFERESFLVLPKSKVIIQPSKGNPISFCWVEFSGMVAESLLAQTAFTKAYPIVGKIRDKNFPDRFIIPDSGLEPAYAQFRAGAKIVVLLSYYIEFFPRKATRHNAYVFTALDYIEENLNNSALCVHDVANYVKIDRTYLYKLIKDEIGLSLIEYINKRRISRAEVLLGNMKTSVKDVALSVGFTDPLYFSRVFKKYNGLTPTEYRNCTQKRE